LVGCPKQAYHSTWVAAQNAVEWPKLASVVSFLVRRRRGGGFWHGARQALSVRVIAGYSQGGTVRTLYLESKG
jgi:hypothetical protein